MNDVAALNALRALNTWRLSLDTRAAKFHAGDLLRSDRVKSADKLRLDAVAALAALLGRPIESAEHVGNALVLLSTAAPQRIGNYAVALDFNHRDKRNVYRLDRQPFVPEAALPISNTHDIR